MGHNVGLAIPAVDPQKIALSAEWIRGAIGMAKARGRTRQGRSLGYIARGALRVGNFVQPRLRGGRVAAIRVA